ncbi:MAG: hypothetical protein WA989_03530, partial [Henriciella sp.]|uniref:hypothetical protein n=1 Tax=Henriciella sp. TaxID=1968823 RepID=UPI003C788F68
MRGLSSSLALKFVAAALFFWVQSTALFDAAAHGGEPHEHYGISCELTAFAAEVAPLPVTPDLPTPPREV